MRTILNDAKARGKELSKDFLNGCFVVTKKESESVYIYEYKFVKLYQCDLSHKSKLERVRDLFLSVHGQGYGFLTSPE